MATLSASRRNSANSTPNTPRPSISGNSMQKMSSLEEEIDLNGYTPEVPKPKELESKLLITILDDVPKQKEQESSDEPDRVVDEPVSDELEEKPLESKLNGNQINGITPKVIKEIRDEVEGNKMRTRACSERSDSGISDCSSHITSSSCTSTPLLGKKFKINEESELEDSKRFVSSTTLILNNGERKLSSEKVTFTPMHKIEETKTTEVTHTNRPANLNLKLSNKIQSFNNNVPAKRK